MKLLKLVNLLTVTVILAAGAVGCKKGLDTTTPLPGRGLTGVPSPGPGSQFGPGDSAGLDSKPIPFDETTGGLATPQGDFSLWTPNRDEFSAQTVYFDFDKSNVKPSEISKLELVAARMKGSFRGKALRVEGHCDERGTEEYNRALGERRALSIRESLVRLGLDPEMIETVSFGEDKPADPGRDEAAFAKNRRGELILLSPPGANP